MMRSIAMALALTASLWAQADVGQKVADFDFGQFLVNGDGRTSLEEFRGSPVLVDFWGTR